MRRPQLDQLLREVGILTGRSELQMIGSQCIHAVTDKPPAEVLPSLACDLLFEPEEPAADVWRVSDIHLRAVLLARLQIVLENVGRERILLA